MRVARTEGEAVKRHPSHYEKCRFDIYNTSKNPREPVRSLAEFSKEIGKPTHFLTGKKSQHNDFPEKKLQSAGTGYYVYADLKKWWSVHKDDI